MISPSRVASSRDVAEHYDQLDPFYREIWGEHVHHGLWLGGRETAEAAVVNLVRLVASRGRIEAGSLVCDVGCGYGGTARLLAREYGALVCGVTVSLVQYRQATAQAGGVTNPAYHLGDWLDKPFQPEMFDVVLAIESSEHMADKRAFFSQSHRVLRKGGRSVVCAWLADEAASAPARAWLLEPICREGRLPGMGTEADYRGWFSEAGMILEEFEDLTARVKRTWKICAFRLAGKLFSQPGYRRFLLDRRANNKIFAATIFRIWLAYSLGVMRYGIFVGRKE